MQKIGSVFKEVWAIGSDAALSPIQESQEASQ